jgi:hypothetical protein
MGDRPRGFAEWNPAPESLALVGQVKEVLGTYSAQLPLTARQIFYVLVGTYSYPKTERDYKNLCEKLVRARRAGMINFADIRDDGTVSLGGSGWSSQESFWRSYERSGRNFRLDRTIGQPYDIEVWCEAAGMSEMLERAVREWDVSVYSTGGFSSVTVTHEIAQRVEYRDRPTIFMHIGDYDPSGESIFESMSEDIAAFVGDPEQFRPLRVALTEEQVEDYGLETAPPKSSDSRSANWAGETCQAEAMPPDQLVELLRDRVLDFIDQDALEETIELEATERAEIGEKLDELLGDE